MPRQVPLQAQLLARLGFRNPNPLGLSDDRCFSPLRHRCSSNIFEGICSGIILWPWMIFTVNGKMDCIYIAPLSKALYNLCLSFTHSPIHPFTHSHTPTAIGCHARYQAARQERLGVRCLAQGHFDTPRVGIEPATLRLPDDCSYLLSHIAP